MAFKYFISVCAFVLSFFLSTCVVGQETKCSTTQISATDHNFVFSWKIEGFRPYMDDGKANLHLVRRNLTFKSDEPEIAESHWDFHFTSFQKGIMLYAVFHPNPQLSDGTEKSKYSKDNFYLSYQISPVIMAKEVSNALEIVESHSPIYLQQTRYLHPYGMNSKTNPHSKLKNYLGTDLGNILGNAHYNGSNPYTSRALIAMWHNILPTLNQTLTDAGEDVNDFTIKFPFKINILKSPFVDSDC